MKFGKLQDISGVNFSFPPEPKINAVRLAERTAAPSPEPLRLYIGCTGWSMPSWVGQWYPKGTKSKGFLEAYGQQFNTIELNTTHYRTPDQALVERWCSQVPDDFRFCPKVLQRISHDRNMGLGGGQLPLFWQALEYFGEKLGCCFIQLPPYFDYSRLELLERFLSAWPRAFPLAVELRHESWFQEEEAIQAFSDLFFKHQVAAVITDVAGRRDVLHLQLTSQQSMIRFVGNGLHPTDFDRARDWCQKIREWQQVGLSEVYLFPHQPDNEEAPKMAQYLADQFANELTIISRGPSPIDKAPPQGQQISLF